MRVALIGNMNNVNFTLLRYFRDAGVDAHLFEFYDDGRESLSHFKLECDSWNTEIWSQYTHQLPFRNSFWSVLFNPKTLQRPVPKKELLKHFSGFDRIICTGIGPALLRRAGIKPTVFFPYCIGVEFLGSYHKMVMSKGNPIRAFFYWVASLQQSRGIQNAKYTFNAELGTTQRQLDRIGATSRRLQLPMVYNKEKYEGFPLSQELTSILDQTKEFEFRVVSHCRQMWINDGLHSNEEWRAVDKHNNWLIEGFLKFLDGGAKNDACLILFDYGVDVGRTKDLIAQYHLQEKVFWAPKLMRKEILYLIDFCSIGVGEFIVYDGTLWGGTALEVLSCSRPLLQTLNFSKDEFTEKFGYPPPPLCDVRSPKDVEKWLTKFYNNREEMYDYGKRSGEWFNKYNGEALALDWLNYLKASD